ncbi:AfsR/SARP family transcriptional regulator [Streptomyces sp. NPDC050560]|uniref:AfsR/SARP family transcriptional regulator n=1 Tax=Streptomyces sp. NPDC050560 TaxID=3365630 RepID=UPI003796B835
MDADAARPGGRAGHTAPGPAGDGPHGTRYQVLGPVECFHGERAVPLGGVRQRRVLAVLLMEAGHVVSTARLIEATWQKPPSTALCQIQIVISRLRKALGTQQDAGAIFTEPSGYRLEIPPGRLDSAAFQERVAAARELAARGALGPAVARLRDGLAMWRGGALAGIEGSSALDCWAGSLREARLAAHELCLRLEIRRGRHAEVVGELMEAARAHPLREALQGLLMQALYLSQRQAEALAVYRATRRRLIGELGVEPGAPLRKLEYDILCGDTGDWAPPAPAAGEPDAPEAAAREPDVAAREPDVWEPDPEKPVTGEPGAGQDVPPEPAPTAPQGAFPEPVTDFVGRAGLLEQLGRRLGPGRRPADGEVPVVVLHGQGGSGKSALAVHAAHLLRPSYPHGLLYADMQEQALRPMTPRGLLRRLLRDLRVDTADIPESLDGRVELLRGLVARRRVLIVVDNVPPGVSPQDVLPRSGRCAVLLTRRSGRGSPGTALLEVGRFDSEASVELLGRIVGQSRVAAEWRAAHLIAQLCDGLPLALRAVGLRLATHPGLRLEEMVRRLGDERRRLSELAHGGAAVRTTLAVAYRGLSPGARRLLRRLGAVDIPAFAPWVAPALLGRGAGGWEAALDELADAHLVEAAPGTGHDSRRYRVPDLVRAFARERAGAEEPADEVCRARHELLEVFLALAARCHRADHGGDHALLHGAAARRREPPLVPALLEREPLRWLDGERANVVWAVREAARTGADEVAWDLAVTAVTLFESRCYYDEWLITHTEALGAVRRVGNRRGEAALLYSLGALNIATQHYAEAGSLLQRALSGFEALGERHGRALALRATAVVRAAGGDRDAARELYREALAECRAVGDRAAEAHVMIGMARAARAEGRPEDAGALLDGALAVCADAGARRFVSRALLCRGMVLLDQGEYEDAERALERALEIVRRRRDLGGEARIAYGMGVLRQGQGRAAEAAGLLHSGIALAESVGNQALRARSLLALGALHEAGGEEAAAAMCEEEARALLRQLGLAEDRAPAPAYRGGAGTGGV